MDRLSRRNFLASGAGAAASAAFLAEPSLAALSSGVRSETAAKVGDKIPWQVQPFPLTQVRLQDALFKNAMEINRRYLHLLPNDRLLHSFRVTAGLPANAAPYGGWEAPDCELRGHFNGGHYLSACALT
jgi:hypothetical protein